MRKRVMAGAGIFFTDGFKVLLLKRGSGDHEGKWGLPGGGLEKGETALEGARREAIEECGSAEGIKFGEIRDKDDNHDWTTFFFKINHPFKCKLSQEHTEYRWVDIDDLSDMNLHPSLRKNLKGHIEIAKKKGFKEWVIARGFNP